MIYIKIPICPKESDYCIDNAQVQKARRINENIRNKERTYDKNNVNITPKSKGTYGIIKYHQ